MITALGWAVDFVSSCYLIQNKNCTVEIILLYYALCGLLVSLISGVFDPNNLVISSSVKSISFSYWAGLGAIAFLGVSATFMLHKAIVYANPVLVSFIRLLDIVFSYSVQIFLFHQIPDVSGIIGSVLVLLGVTFLTLEERLLSTMPKKFRQLLGNQE